MKPTSQETTGLAPWLSAAAAVLVFSAGTTWLSGQFVYGEGHETRPIREFVMLYGIGWAGFAAASLLALRRQRRPRATMVLILVVAALARLALLPSDLVQENDCYRYVLDGECMRRGINPFRHAPRDIANEAPPAFAAELAGDDAQLILARIGYPEISTIYPPLAQWTFAIGSALTPWDWRGQRIVFVVVDMATILLLLALLHHWRRPLAWAVVYAWNPLPLKEIANSAHVDSLVGPLLLLTCLALVRAVDRRSAAWAFAAGCTLAGAVLTKLYPVLLAPLGLVYLAEGKSWRRPAWFALGLGLTGLLAYVPFLDVGLDRVTAGLRAYGEEWVRNDGAYGLVAAVAPRPRWVCSGIIILVAGWAALALWRRERTVDGLVAAMQTALLTWFLFLPAAFPWYAVGLAALTAMRPRMPIIVLSGALGLYYLIFFYEYNDMPDAWNLWTRVVEHGLVWATLAAGALAGHRRRATAHRTNTDGEIGVTPS